MFDKKKLKDIVDIESEKIHIPTPMRNPTITTSLDKMFSSDIYRMYPDVFTLDSISALEISTDTMIRKMFNRIEGSSGNE